MLTLDPEEIHQFLEDWARLEADFDDGPDTVAHLVSTRIAQRLRMPVERISGARKIRNRCAHLDSSLTNREVAESRAVLDEALMRYLSVDVLDHRRITDESGWVQQGRASRCDRHEYLIKYASLLNDAREFHEIGSPAAQHISHSDFRRCRKIRDQVSHPAPPPLKSDLLRAMQIMVALEHTLRQLEESRRVAAEQLAAKRREEELAAIRHDQDKERHERLVLACPACGRRNRAPKNNINKARCALCATQLVVPTGTTDPKRTSSPPGQDEIHQCAECGKRNRIPAGLQRSARCGSCGSLLMVAP